MFKQAKENVPLYFESRNCSIPVIECFVVVFFFQMQVKIVIVGIKNTKGANVILKT